MVQADRKRLHALVRLVDYLLVESQIVMLERNVHALQSLYRSTAVLHCKVSFRGQQSFTFEPGACRQQADMPVKLLQRCGSLTRAAQETWTSRSWCRQRSATTVSAL